MLADRLLRLPRRVRLLLLPAALLAAVGGTTFALAQLHLAKPDAPKSSGAVALGDAYQGQLVFEDTCSGCHGSGGEGGGVGPRLAGNTISLAQAQAIIDAGRGVMPAGLVSGAKKRDVLAYLATLLDVG
ncbi:MAG: c-type cytochrome [Gaiellaceae bacterium]